MQGQGFYDQNGCLVYPDEMGAFVGNRRGVQRIVRTPAPGLTRRYRQPFRPIGGDIKTWWGSLSQKWRWGIVGGIGVLAVITAALGKKEGKGSWLKKV